MNLLVCGSRTWEDRSTITTVLTPYLMLGDAATLIHGAARGADSIAADVALRHNSHAHAVYDRGYPIPARIEAFPADWETHGKAAGFIRNKAMLERLLELPEPRLVVAFRRGAKSVGTDMMLKLATHAGVDTLVYSRQ